jgi:hypothetical protein
MFIKRPDLVMFGRLDDDHELLLVFCPEAGRLSAHLTPEYRQENI